MGAFVLDLMTLVAAHALSGYHLKFSVMIFKDFQTQKEFKDLHTLNAFCLFEKEDLIRVPIMEGISYHVQENQPLLPAEYKNTHLSDFHTIINM